MQSIDKPREQAVTILRLAEEGVFADSLLDQARQSFESRDSAFITELVYGVLRNRERIDWTLDRFSKKPVAKCDSRTRNILRLGAYQMMFLDRVPTSAAINTAVNLAKHHGKTPGYVNGLLRSLDRNRNSLKWPGEPLRLLSVLYSHPEWITKRWVERLGNETAESILAANNRPAPLTIRTNTLRTTRANLKDILAAAGAQTRETGYSPVGLEIVSSPGLKKLAAFRDGLFMVQDESAQLIGMMLAPRPDDTVLDACAAPGGKATHLAELMEDQGTIIALESDSSRIKRITENSARLGVSIVKSVHGNAAVFKDGAYDKVLIDSPCSGLGVLRRHPDGRWTKKEAIIAEKQAVQKKILENCSRLLKPGGALVYATCTTEPEENEDIIEGFLLKHPEFMLDDPRPQLPPEASELVGNDFFFRTFPEKTDMDGFFGARMVKK